MTEPNPADVLEPCPFCGGEAILDKAQYGGTGSSGMETPEPFARCKSGCVAMRPVTCTDWPYGKKDSIPTSLEAKAIAIAAWNTRAALQQSRSAVEALRMAREYVQNVVDAEGKAFNVRDLAQIDAALLQESADA